MPLGSEPDGDGRGGGGGGSAGARRTFAQNRRRRARTHGPAQRCGERGLYSVGAGESANIPRIWGITCPSHFHLLPNIDPHSRPPRRGTGRGGSQRRRRDPAEEQPPRFPAARARNGRVLPAKFSLMGTGLAVTWIRRSVWRTPRRPPSPAAPPRRFRAPRKGSAVHSPPLRHGGAAGGGTAPGYCQQTIREPAPPATEKKKNKKEK